MTTGKRGPYEVGKFYRIIIPFTLCLHTVSTEEPYIFLKRGTVIYIVGLAKFLGFHKMYKVNVLYKEHAGHVFLNGKELEEVKNSDLL